MNALQIGRLVAATNEFDKTVASGEGDGYINAAKVYFGVTEVTPQQRTHMKAMLFPHIHGKRAPS